MGVGADALDVWLWRFHQAKGSVQLCIQHKHIQTSTLLGKGKEETYNLICVGKEIKKWVSKSFPSYSKTRFFKEKWKERMNEWTRNRITGRKKKSMKRMKNRYLCIPVSTESASLFMSLSITNPITWVLKFCSPNIAYMFSVDDTSESIVLVSKDHLFRLVFTCRSTQFDGSSSQVS